MTIRRQFPCSTRSPRKNSRTWNESNLQNEWSLAPHPRNGAKPSIVSKRNRESPGLCRQRRRITNVRTHRKSFSPLRRDSCRMRPRKRCPTTCVSLVPVSPATRRFRQSKSRYTPPLRLWAGSSKWSISTCPIVSYPYAKWRFVRLGRADGFRPRAAQGTALPRLSLHLLY